MLKKSLLYLCYLPTTCRIKCMSFHCEDFLASSRDFTLYFLLPFHKREMFLCWGRRFTNKSQGPSEKQSSQGERSVPPVPTCSSASGTYTHCCKLPLPPLPLPSPFALPSPSLCSSVWFNLSTIIWLSCDEVIYFLVPKSFERLRNI